MARLDDTLVRRFKLYAQIATVVIMVFSLLVLVGWATNEPQLMCLCPSFGGERILPFMGRMHSTAAITLLIYSAALLIVISTKSRWLRLTGEALTGLMVTGAIFSLVVTVGGADIEGIRICQIDPSAAGITYPIPLSPEIAFDLICLGVAIILLRLNVGRSITAAQALVLAAVPVPLLIVLGAATQIQQLCALGGCFTMSTSYAVLALVLCSAIFFSQPEVGLAAMFAGRRTASLVLRRASLFLCLIPALLIVRSALVILPLQITPEVSWVIFVFITLVTAVAFLLPGVKAFDKIESELSDQLLDTMNELEQTRQSRADMDAAAGVTHGSMTIKYKRICLTCANEFDDSHKICPNDSSPLSRVVDDSLIGETFNDKYEIVEVLGSGGMSTVYKAHHKFLNKTMALKVLKNNTASNTDSLKRFQREARATGALDHQGIVGISDFGLSPDGRAFLIMDYLEGESLSSMLDRVGPLKLSQVLGLGLQICDALAAAHAKGVVHRDLKPSNIMLVKQDGENLPIAKIVDFGLAKIVEEDGRNSMKITQTGECFGSPLYMSPEQCMGENVDHRTDIYALGCILYEMITGYPPIMGKNPADTVRRQVSERPAPIPGDIPLPKEIRVIVYQCLQKNPSWRPQDVTDVQNVLGKVGARI